MLLSKKTIRTMRKDREKGFTLIELMIVVAILGILAAIAIPNFMRFQAKSKQSEAKTNLGAIGTTAEAYRSENDSYSDTPGAADGTTVSLAVLGWAPQGSTRYMYGYNGNVLAGHPSLAGNCATATAGTIQVSNDAAVTDAAFTAEAHGDVDTDATCDTWTYTQARVLTNTTNDVGN